MSRGGREIIKSIAQSFEQGRNSPESIAYCGVSLEGVRRLVLLGNIECSSINPLWKQYLPIIPIRGSHTFPGTQYLNEAEAFSKACDDAGNIARARYFLKAFEIKVGDRDFMAQALQLTAPAGRRVLISSSSVRLLVKRIKNNIEEAKAVIEESGERKGVVLAIRYNPEEEFRGETGTRNEPYFTWYRPNGLSYQSICGIEPLDDEGYKYFEELQSKIKV